jgi:UDP-N-acetyl-D-mannosaminuronic acid dehydrogenase
MLAELQEQIERKTARLGIVGLGYVGLPVAASFAAAGFEVAGVERRAGWVAEVNAGRCPIQGKEPGLAELLAQVRASGRLHATTDYAELSGCAVVLIAVETPVDEQRRPNYAALRAVLTGLGPVLRPGALVIVESTLAPGTMQALVAPLLEQATGGTVDRDFYLGHCPERVMPGKLLANLRSQSRVVGGNTPETAAAMVALYRHVVAADLDPVDCVTAELVKTVENAYRDVQIAFANEVALICEAVGADVWRVRELVNKSPSRVMHLPGAGVGGHCIPKDPWLLASGAAPEEPVRLIAAARAINDGMPHHVVALVRDALAAAGRAPAGARIAVLGYSYLEESGDTRNSPSVVVVDALRRLGAEVAVHDPYVPEYQGEVRAALQDADATVVMVRHQEYLALDLAALRGVVRLPVLVDGRRILDPEQARAHGWDYHALGVGSPVPRPADVSAGAGQ